MAANPEYVIRLPHFGAAGRELIERLDRIERECASPLGYAARGVASWDQELMSRWRADCDAGIHFALSPHEEAILRRIERQVFGELERGRRG